MIRAVLFDLDNTLVMEDEATVRSIRHACALAARKTGADPDALVDLVSRDAGERFAASAVFPFADRVGVWWGEALWGEFTGERAEIRAIREMVPGFRHAVWSNALKAAGVSDDALADELAADYARVRRADQVIDPEAGAVLDDLGRDHLLALVTNGAPDVQREKLAGTPFASRFNAIVISVEVGFGKPDPRLFTAATDMLGVTAREAVMVGDSIERDVAGAHAAGMRAIWIDRGLWPVTRDAPTPDARVTRLSELRASLSALAPGGASPRGSRGSRPASPPRA